MRGRIAHYHGSQSLFYPSLRLLYRVYRPLPYISHRSNRPTTKPRKNKVFNAKQRRFLRAAAVSGLLCGQPFLPAAALNIQDFQPNCDIRQLRLSREQYEELRSLRGEYKQAVERLNAQNRHSERARRDHLLRILSSSQFDERLAHRYIGERYETGLQFAEEELGIQYKFYQLLNPQQQRVWVQKCLT